MIVRIVHIVHNYTEPLEIFHKLKRNSKTFIHYNALNLVMMMMRVMMVMVMTVMVVMIVLV